LIFQFGIQIGNVRLGKQLDLKTTQSADFSQSLFYKNYYTKDKLTVLNVWATWCVPCINEMPMLNQVKRNFQNDAIEFLSISVDKDSLRFVKFNEKGTFNFHDITMADLKYRNAILNTLEGNEPDKWISSYSIPITYLLKDNKVLH